VTAAIDVLFLDANILFSAAWSTQSPIRRLWQLAGSSMRLITSDLAVREARRNLPAAQQSALDDLLRDLTVVPTPAPDTWRPLPAVQLPAKDEPILQAAIAAGATHLITGDRTHFGPLFGRRIEGVLIIPPADYSPPASPSP
jgi:uncharacterized protein